MGVREGFLSFGFRVFLYVVFGLLLSDAILYYVTDHTIGGSYYDALVILGAAKHTTFALTITLNAIIQFGVLAVIFVASVIMSNRIAGPMYRFENVARFAKQGDLCVSVRLRQDDFMRAQAEDFEAALSVMCGRIEDMRGAAASIREKMAEMEAGGAKDQARADELVRGMKSEADRIRETLSFFKT